MKQTAVEWLVNKLNNDFENNDFLISYANEISQAKELEKRQIMGFTIDFIDKYTYSNYYGDVQKSKTIEEYYNETFKNK